ncbi:MAG TPA: sigma-70 family RNA polymerase sigma factor [Acidimicrobiales bacterium]|nr:sigma-70 family RNA polymerase sigma factor [Acidimicrobiales bacterium]
MTVTAPDEADLVVQARAGDAAAFSELHRRYRRSVEGVIRTQTRNASDVPDLTQETFVAAWRRLGSLRDEHRFRAWILQIARHVVIDHARSVGRRPVLTTDDALALDLTESTDPGPDELVDLIDLAAEVRGALDGCSRRDVVAITLVAQFGFGPTEIAEALGVTPNHAKVILHRARRRLRAAMA